MTDFKLPDAAELKRIIKNALAEDIGKGDITSDLLIPAETKAELGFVARETLIVCGLFIPEMVYDELGAKVQVRVNAKEGEKVASGQLLVSASGQARALLTGERVALNLMQRMSGVANLTREFVDAVKGTKAVILDTRKTMPGLRAIDKYAVHVGGGENHRMRLDDMVLIKDNHIALSNGIISAIEIARKAIPEGMKIVVECDTLEQVKEAITANPDRILLDNMSNADLVKAVAMSGGKIPLEASGGVSLKTVRGIAETGVDYISVGSLTHSAIAADIGADIEIKARS